MEKVKSRLDSIEGKLDEVGREDVPAKVANSADRFIFYQRL